MQPEWLESIGKHIAPLVFLEIWKHYVDRKARYCIMLMVKGRGVDLESGIATLKLAKKRMTEMVRSWKSDGNVAHRDGAIGAARKAF